MISRFTLTHKRFALGAKPTAVRAATRQKPKTKPVARGTVFTFRLTQAATTRIAITQKGKGHRASRKRPCTVARRGQKRNCTRTVTLLTLVRAHSRKGSDRVVFSGRYGKKHLARGTYTATITATNAAKKRSKPRSLTFTIVG